MKEGYCLHCKTPTATNKRLTSGQFCCQGCKKVYEFIQTHQLSSYYDLKENAATIKPTHPVRPNNQSYSYLDRAETIASLNPDQQNTLTFYLEGIHCVACLWLLEQLPSLVPGITNSSVNIGTSQMTIQKSDNGKFSDIAATLAHMGYPPHPLKKFEGSEYATREHRNSLIRLGVAGACAMNIMLFSIGLYAGVDGSIATLFQIGIAALSLPVILYASLPFYKGSLAAIRMRHITIDVPVVIAIISGSLASYINLVLATDQFFFDSIAVFVFLLLSTRHFFKYTAKKLDQDALLQAALIPKIAHIKNGENTETVLAETLTSEDKIYVDTDSVIPADGHILSTAAKVDAHIITGEFQATSFKKDEMVYAGMKNVGPPLEIAVSASGQDTRVGRLLKKIQSGQRPTMVQLADDVSRWFLWVTLAFAAILLLWDSVSNGISHLAYQRTLALIILACPCALSLATPLSYGLSIKAAGQSGIGVKNADIFEALGDITQLVFDKTGTLTTGQMTVLDWKSVNASENSYFWAYQLERQGTHPAAKAILRYLDTRQNKFPKLPMAVNEIAGYGIKGTIDNNTFTIKPRPDRKVLDGITTQVSLYKNKEEIATITLGDQLWPDSRQTCQTLAEDGMDILVLSGDHDTAVRAVTDQLSVSRYKARQTPESKAKEVDTHGHTLIVGDGANDALAMSKAKASVAVQGSLEISMITADAYLTVPGVSVIPTLLELAKRTRKTIRQNFAMSLIYNAIGIIFVLSGLISPLIAAILMPASAASVFLYSVIRLQPKTTL